MKNVAKNRADETRGDLPGRWTCPGCSTTFRVISEWRCARCGTPQPGADAADPAQMRAQLQFIEPLRKALDLDRDLLYSAHPADVQVLLDARIEKDDDCHTPKDTRSTPSWNSHRRAGQMRIFRRREPSKPPVRGGDCLARPNLQISARLVLPVGIQRATGRAADRRWSVFDFLLAGGNVQPWTATPVPCLL